MALCGWIRYGKSRRWVWLVVFLVRSLAITRQPLSFRVYVCQPLHRRSISITFIETLGRCPRRRNITPTSGMADASKEGYSYVKFPCSCTRLVVTWTDKHAVHRSRYA